MAKNKTSFVLYSDSKSIIDLMTNEQAGLLLKTLFSYVNDENPKIDTSIALVFEMIKLQLKRDLKKWEQTKEGRSIAGKASAEAKKLAKLNQQNSTNLTNVDFVQQTSTNSTVSVSVSDNVNETDIKNNNINSRKLKFAHTLKPFLDLYGKDMIRSFYEYWTEHGEKDLKFRMEKEKSFGIERRLKTWSTNNYNKKPQTNEELNNLTTEIRNNNPRI